MSYSLICPFSPSSRHLKQRTFAGQQGDFAVVVGPYWWVALCTVSRTLHSLKHTIAALREQVESSTVMSADDDIDDLFPAVPEGAAAGKQSRQRSDSIPTTVDASPLVADKATLSPSSSSSSSLSSSSSSLSSSPSPASVAPAKKAAGFFFKPEALSDERQNKLRLEKEREQKLNAEMLAERQRKRAESVIRQKQDEERLAQPANPSIDPLTAAATKRASNNGGMRGGAANANAMNVYISPYPLGTDSEYWQPDESASNCVKCNAGFSMLFRRHHCRYCGFIFCKSCVSNSVQGAKACDRCYKFKSNQTVSDNEKL